MKSEIIRCFLAFDIENKEVIKKVQRVQQLLFKTGAALKIVNPENVHITIRFLGNTPLNIINKISNKLQEIEFNSFPIEIRGIGVFPNLKRPRVVWIGIKQGSEQLKIIFNQIEPKLNKIGFTPDRKGFSPHLTIARVKSGKNRDVLINFIKENSGYDFGRIKLKSLKLKKSDLLPKGPVYTTIKQFRPSVEVISK